MLLAYAVGPTTTSQTGRGNEAGRAIHGSPWSPFSRSPGPPGRGGSVHVPEDLRIVTVYGTLGLVRRDRFVALNLETHRGRCCDASRCQAI
jgi:hypothetical protein